MGKYSTQFKITAVMAYINGNEGFRKIAQRYSIDFSLLRRWVAAYQAQGSCGLRSRGQHCSPAFKVSVLECMHKERLSYREVAARFGLGHSSCVGIWERQYYSGGLAALTRAKPERTVPMPKMPSIEQDSVPVDDDSKSREQLKAELDYLRMENAYLKKLEEVQRMQKTGHRPGKKRSP